MLYRECLGMHRGLVNNMWYHSVPAEAPVFQRNAAREKKQSFTADCLRPVFVAPHLGEAVILRKSTRVSSLICALASAVMWLFFVPPPNK